MALTRIADFEVGRPTEGEFAVLRKTRLRNKNGDAYLVLELSDATGRIEGRVWQNAEYFDRNVQAGDRVKAIGKPTMFRETMQFDIRRLDRAEGGMAEAFIPAARRDLDELAGELDFLLDEVEHPQLRALLEEVWRGPGREALVRSPATAADHHAYLGGLVEHTVSVAAICMAAAERHDGVDRGLLLTAALLHDVGRAREITVGSMVSVEESGALYGHVLLGHELLIEAAAAVSARPGHPKLTEQEWWPRLVHAISQHHGPLERCRTREATILASTNALDVRLAMR